MKQSGEPSLNRADADPSPSELSVGVGHDADGSTRVQTGARGVPAILAFVAVVLMLIVVGGFVAVFALAQPQHETSQPGAAHQSSRSTTLLGSEQ
jgi:hypothetical protein